MLTGCKRHVDCFTCPFKDCTVHGVRRNEKLPNHLVFGGKPDEELWFYNKIYYKGEPAHG